MEFQKLSAGGEPNAPEREFCELYLRLEREHGQRATIDAMITVFTNMSCMRLDARATVSGLRIAADHLASAYGVAKNY